MFELFDASVLGNFLSMAICLIPFHVITCIDMCQSLCKCLLCMQWKLCTNVRAFECKNEIVCFVYVYVLLLNVSLYLDTLTFVCAHIIC